jgi:L-alanine-DL-glutamate epimerase-like enolase superfamily enzyme
MRAIRTIDQLRTSVYSVPVEPGSESDGTLTWDHTTVVAVEVTAAGSRGLGFTYGPAAVAAVVEELLADSVVGREPLDVVGAWDRMVRAVRNAGRPGLVSMAIAAVDLALWDLKARLLDVALVDLLGACRPSIDVYGSGGFTSLTDRRLCEQLGSWVDAGIPRVKMKIATGWGSDPARDLERVALVRARVGPDAELLVDANGGYGRKQAVALAHDLADLGVTWFEEPVSSDDLEGLHEIRGLIDVEVAAGEYGYDLAYFRQMCGAGAVDVVQADVTRCAGITEWLRIAALAAGHGLEISGHCAPNLHAHVACAVPNARHVELFADHARVDRLLFDGVVEPAGGALEPDRGRPGHGLAVSAAAHEHRIDPQPSHRSTVASGAGRR